MGKPSGITVVDLSLSLTGPLSTLPTADQRADVFIEGFRPGVTSLRYFDDPAASARKTAPAIRFTGGPRGTRHFPALGR